MDTIETAYAFRARAALDMMTGGAQPEEKKSAAFVDAALLIAKAQDAEGAMGAMQRSNVELLTKAASAHTTLDEAWQGDDMQALARGFIASIGEPDLLTAISRFARVMPKAASRVLIATGSTGDTVAEGFPKIVRRIDLTVGPDLPYAKSVAAVVVSRELLMATGDAGRQLFESELGKAMVRAANEAVLSMLLDTSIIGVPAGADPLASLRAGLLAAGPSTGYVVTAPAAWVAWLATATENRGGMGVRGGTFVPGVEIVAMDDATTMVLVPADRLAVFDGGTELRPAGHATVDMSDSPTTAGEKVSLWQTNSIGLLVERHWRIEGDTSGMVVVGV